MRGVIRRWGVGCIRTIYVVHINFTIIVIVNTIITNYLF